MKTSDAIAHFSSIKALCAVLGITKAAVSQWGDTVPWRRQLQLERITGGVLKHNPADIPSDMIEFIHPARNRSRVAA